jgi:predicted TIM-barrel fold metal-dependent hydrolase
LTFQNDAPALENKHRLNIRHLLWANDYPHPDSTWPRSHNIIETHMKNLSDAEREMVLFHNTRSLYQLDSIGH